MPSKPHHTVRFDYGVLATLYRIFLARGVRAETFSELVTLALRLYAHEGCKSEGLVPVPDSEVGEEILRNADLLRESRSVKFERLAN